MEELVKAQNMFGGGKEHNMKRTDYDKVISIILKLPPGSPLSIAYKNAANIEALPKDPLSPSSAARGVGA